MTSSLKETIASSNAGKIASAGNSIPRLERARDKCKAEYHCMYVCTFIYLSINGRDVILMKKFAFKATLDTFAP